MISLIIEAVARSIALGLILWLVLTLTRSRNPHLHKMLWAAVLLASLVIPLVMRARVGPVIPAPDIALTLRALRAGSIGSAPWQPAWSSGFSVLYLSLALLLLARYARSLWRMWRIQRAAEVVTDSWATDLDVRVTAAISSPATFGSTILLPAHFKDWSSQKLHAVLAHERAHVQQWDCYVLWLARLHTCLFWINPMAWWLQRRLAWLAETTSDEAAMVAVGDRAGYAEILLEFASQRAVSDVATAMARPNISLRIERILAQTAPAAIPGLSKRIMVLAALLPAVAATAAPLGPTPLVQLSPAAAIKTPSDFPGLEKYYPKEALRRGIDGLVQIQVTLDAEGRPTDTLILSEDPLDLGFGAAASLLAHVYEYDNPTGRPAQLTFRVKFELQPDHPTYGTTNFEDPGSAKSPE